MRAAQRKPAASLIRRLLDQPYRFEFVQAIRILHAWLAHVLPGVPDTPAKYVRFRNRPSLAFPPSQIDALAVETEASIDSDDDLSSAATAGQLRRISVTPAFGGLLGVTGALPLHYTETLLAAQERAAIAGQLEFFDLLSQRANALHFEAWTKTHVHHSTDTQGAELLRQMQWALAGVLPRTGPEGHCRPIGVLDGDIPAFYAGVFRHYSTSPQVLEDVLSEYFGVPFNVEPFIGEWLKLEPHESPQIGSGCSLEGLVLGPRAYSKTERVRLRIGPLSLDEFERFLPGSEGARALASMVSLFRVADLTFEAQLVLRASDVVPAALSANCRPGLGLGYAAISITRPTSIRDHNGPRYELATYSRK